VPFVFPAEFLQHFPADLADVPLADDTVRALRGV
jgi:hypothetical protein